MSSTSAAPAASRRFYAGCDVAPVEGGFAVRLDGRIARSPGAAPLVAPTEALARLIASEWAAQGETIVFAAMPATRLLHTALDAVPGRRREIAASVAGQAASDVICYFAEGPASLMDRQARAWRPLLTWARVAFGLDFATGRGIAHVTQPPATLAAVETLVRELDDFALAAIGLAAASFSSAILALALRSGRLDGHAAFAASRIDEAFQEQRWGVDGEAAARSAAMEAEAVMLDRWFGALGRPGRR